MSYYLTDVELRRLHAGLKTAMAIPFIDDVEDYILEAVWEYAKMIDGPDPFYTVRSKKLYDVVDQRSRIGWSVKSLQWPFYDNCQFELVIQRADVFKKAAQFGFSSLSKESDPNQIGAALLAHWRQKVEQDAIDQGVDSKRIMVLLKSVDRRQFAVYEDDIQLYVPEELTWQWTNREKNGLQGIRISDRMCVYRWYPSQKQFFERFLLPDTAQHFQIKPLRLTKKQVVEILSPHLEE